MAAYVVLEKSGSLIAIWENPFAASIWANQFLNWGANNHFVCAKSWDAKKELVLITGGSGGIGASTARRLASEGTRVVILDILPLSFLDSI